MFVALPCLTSSDTATSRSNYLSISRSRLPTLICTCTCAVWCADEGIGRAAAVRRRKDGKVGRVVQRSAPRMDSNRSNHLPIPLTHCRQPHACPRPHLPLGHNCRGPYHRPRTGVRTGAAFIPDCGCAAARRNHRREPRSWGDVVDARTVYGNGVPVWDCAKCRARHPAAAAFPAVFLCRIFAGEENGADSDSNWEWRARGGPGGRCKKRTGRVVC